MAKLIYQRDDNEYSFDSKRVQFDVSDDMTIDAFRDMCIRMAYAIGYQHLSISNSFGFSNEREKKDKEDMNTLIQLLNEIENDEKRRGRGSSIL
jgi:vacuolar-type H+-ATPase subunit I/STV1